MKIPKGSNYSKEYIAGYRDGAKDAVSGKLTDGAVLEIAYLPIKAMEVSTRAKNCLFYSGFTNVGELLALNSEEIMRIRNLGQKTASEIAKWLIESGILNSAWSEYV